MELRTELLQHLGLGTFVVLDFETTGLDPEKEEIIEIGAIKFVNGEEAEIFDEMVNPGRPIPEFISRLTGIRDGDVANAQRIAEVIPRLEAFIGDASLVGQQVNFDASFLEYYYRKQHNDFENWENQTQRFKYLDNFRVDTLFIARILKPFLSSFKLAALAGHIGYDLGNAHRAIEDARAAGHVFLELIDRALSVHTSVLSNVINLLYPNSVRAKNFWLPTLNFRKMKGIMSGSVTLLDDVQNAQQFYNVLGDGNYQAQANTEEPDMYSIDLSVIDEYFSADGRLSKIIENYELRHEQQEMARLISECFNGSRFIVTEAGTGTGKSMAYLIPAVEWAIANRQSNQRIIVSTNTKNLQEQLFFKDIPMLYAARAGGFKAVLLKGRSNYLCLDKWHSVLTDMNQRLSQDERSRILPLTLWAQQTRTGDIAENSGFQLERNIGLWQKLTAEAAYCPGRACKYYSECFLMKIRDHARKADVVVVNHSLLFSDLASDNSILDQYANLIVDEAHNIEKAAADHLGARVSYWTFRNFYHQLYDEEPKRSGALVQLEFRLDRGALTPDEGRSVAESVNLLKRQNLLLKEKVQIFYNELSRVLRSKFSGSNNTDDNRVRYFKNFKYFAQLSSNIAEVKENLSAALNGVRKLLEILQDLKKDRFEFQEQIIREFLSLEDDAARLLEAFTFCIEATEEKYVYWLDIPRQENSNDIVLHAVPLNISELLNSRLYKPLSSAVFTSATLAVGKSFGYFLGRVGLNLAQDKSVQTSILGSPFDYDKQIKIAVADFLPDPRSNDYNQELISTIREMHLAHKTGMLVLFTSYGLLNLAYDRLKPHFDAERILLLAQGKSGSRSNILMQFKENRDSVLFGTDSFWEGVDVPGEALELLFIPKLPFDVPTEPLIQARMDEIKKRGGNPFYEYSVPEAIIKLRQGFGRLIRTKTDRGVVILGDNRLSRMQYGRQFLESLPAKTDVYSNLETLLSSLKEFFSK
jgi:predicted DnaQ family exonuclease/DinG family helicase